MLSNVEEIELAVAEAEKVLAELEAEPKGKSKRGRPSKFTPEVVTKLLAAFNMGYNDTEAVLHAEISRKSYYAYLNEHPDFRNRINRAKIEPTIKAKEVVVNAVNAGDLKASQWWLERKAASEFSTKPKNEPDVPAELREHIEVVANVVKVQEKLIATNYRTAIYRLREQERANNRSRNGKPSPKEDFYTRLLELPDDKLADHVQQEVTATGQDIAGVRTWLLHRLDAQSAYQDELERAKHWNDLD
jgi:hypothetical protein